MICRSFPTCLCPKLHLLLCLLPDGLLCRPPSRASLSVEALNIPRSCIRDVFDRVERVPDAISLTVGEPSATAAPHIVAAACEAAQAGRTRYTNVLGVPEYCMAVADHSSRARDSLMIPKPRFKPLTVPRLACFWR